MNYKISVSYNGTNFHGWAKQNKLRTVQGEIENIFFQIYQKKINIFGSGRTDAYVHAIEQVFSFNEDKLNIDPKKLLMILNSLSPEDIYFVDVKEVNKKFHARFSAKNKTYLYKINCSQFNVFEANLIYQYGKKINLKKMKKASKLFLGEQNFLSFSTSDKKNTIRIINKIKIYRKKQYIYFEIVGNGFLRNMVRMIIASFIDINEGKKDNNDIFRLLNNPKKGSSISKLPGCGLYLKKVQY